MTQKILLYDGLDTSGDSELWRTNATSSGTIEITPGLEAPQVGINPRWICVYNGKALFNGVDGNGKYNLWVTYGTAASTQELTGIVGANPGGLYPEDMTVYDNTVLFQGQSGLAGANVTSLWMTNGTQAGTVQIGGNENQNIANAYSGGLLAVGNPDFTNFQGVVLFRGRDAANNVGLWETNGTAQGTFEIQPIANAMTVGSPGSDVQPQSMAVLGSEVLFDGADTEDTSGSLWETNGTPSGTIEIGGLGNAQISGSPNGNKVDLPIGIFPQDLTTFNGKVLFAGTDSTTLSNGGYAHTEGLWITDGTAAGTSEIGGLGNAGISGINAPTNGGIFWAGSIEYPDFTVYNNIALFVGLDSSNHVGLWRTDGTTGGTYEIGGLGNAQIAGGLTLDNSISPDFTVYDGVVVFNGTDSSGHYGLWVTNGTAAGTHELTTPSFGAPYAPLGPGFTPYGETVADDFKVDSKSDLLLENTSGAVYVGEVSNGTTTYTGVAGLGPEWSFKGTGDFLGDGNTDFLIENTSGAVYVGEVSNGTTTYTGVAGLGSEWKFVGTGDFLGNGRDQFLIENSAGAVDVGNVVSGKAQYTQVAALGPEWSFKESGNFLGNGKTDFLIENTSGAVDVGEVSGGTTSYTQIGALGSEWKFVGSADFLGGAQDQFLIENTSGAVYVANVVNGQAQYTRVAALGPEWSFIGAGDYLGTGTAGFMIENTAGAVVLGTIANGQASYTQVGGLGSEWTSHSHK